MSIIFFVLFKKKCRNLWHSQYRAAVFAFFFFLTVLRLPFFCFIGSVRFSFCALRLFAKVGTRKNKKAAKALTVFECPLLTVRNTCDKITKTVLAHRGDAVCSTMFDFYVYLAKNF